MNPVTSTICSIICTVGIFVQLIIIFFMQRRSVTRKCEIERLNKEVETWKEDSKQNWGKYLYANNLYNIAARNRDKFQKMLDAFEQPPKQYRIYDTGRSFRIHISSNNFEYPHATCTVKEISYDRADPDDRDFAFRETHELIDTIKNW